MPLTIPHAAAPVLEAAAPTSIGGGTDDESPLKAILARAEHQQQQRGSNDEDDAARQFDKPALRLSPPPSSSAPRAGFASALKAHGYAPPSSREPESMEIPPDRHENTAPVIAWVHEEVRSQWAADRQTMAGTRGLVFALPTDSQQPFDVVLRGAVCAAADISSSAGGRVELLPVDATAVQDSSTIPDAELWKQTRAIVQDHDRAVALIRATNAAGFRLHAPAAPRSQPIAVCKYILGAQYTPPLLMANIKRRAVVAPFKTAAELAVVLRCFHTTLHNVCVTLHIGDAVGEGALAVMKTSHPGQWSPDAETFTWKVEIVEPGHISLRVQLSADPRIETRLSRPPAHAIITAALPAGVLASKLEVCGAAATSSTHVYSLVYISAADAARHTHKSTSRAQHMMDFAATAVDAPEYQSMSSSDDGYTSPRSATPAPLFEGYAEPTSAAPMRVTALFDFTAGETERELSFCAGDALDVVSAAHGGWYEARSSDGQRGLVPAAYMAIE